MTAPLPSTFRQPGNYGNIRLSAARSVRYDLTESMEPAACIKTCAPADLPQILEIEQVSYPRPWSEKQFRAELVAPYSTVLVLQENDRVAGYLCYWLAAGELHILNLATAPESRRRRVGSRLLEHALLQARGVEVEVACLEVRVGNIGAIELYRRFGFRDDCVRPGYYADGEDALLMSLPLASA